MNPRHSIALCLSVLLWACGSDDHTPNDTTHADSDAAIEDLDTTPDIEPLDTSDTRDTSDTTPDVPDTTDTWTPPPWPGAFVRDHVVEVTLTLPTADWSALCSQRRSIFSLLGEGCMAAPTADVFTWFKADATFDGRRVPEIGVRKKGFLGSLDSERPGLRLELDRFVQGQKLSGLERLTLNNGKQDSSRLRQCLAYDLFRAAGVAAPRCAFARVIVNRIDLGLYIHVEAVKKPFLRDWFGDIAVGDAGDGALWEGQLSDFRPGWLDTFEPKHDGMGPADRALLDAVVTAMDGDDDGLLQRLDEVLDLEGFITFWAVESLTAHWDGLAGNTNNFFVYAPPGPDRRLRFIPWGVDQTFVDPTPFSSTRAVFATSALTRRLYVHPEGRARFQAKLVELLDTIWDEEALLASVESMAVRIRPYREPGTREQGDEAVAQVANFIVTRRDDVRGELANTLPAFPPALRNDLCLNEDGVVTATFSTTWGTLHLENLFLTGSGTLTVESPSLPELPATMVGSKAGYSQENQSGQIVLGAMVSGGGFMVVIIDVAEYPETGVIPLGVFPQAAVYYGDPSGAVVMLGLLSGTLELDAIEATAGAAVRGRLDAKLWTGL